MKNLLSVLTLLTLLVFGGCKKDDEVKPIPTGDIDLGFFKISADPATGQTTNTPIQCTIWMWKTDNRNLDLTSSGSEIYLGRILDKNTNKYVSAEYGAIGINMREKVETGKYLVYVFINKSDQKGSLAYTYTNVEIKEDKKVSLRKVFSQDIGTQQYEAWNTNK
ncbi:hypothetical protein HUW51_13575 [Adhaeribacter swui]|uniref:Lipoprotein n=1 Tax=Adhaeribacter swui TaxID=2086471 RepID=A0A7G7G964_9BACT|nr:hypothetical protein [Adhaeribacter swui]QNF33698.1 hypothetical protein HUW51_13575 [Adhaeribacter swui]